MPAGGGYFHVLTPEALTSNDLSDWMRYGHDEMDIEMNWGHLKWFSMAMFFFKTHGHGVMDFRVEQYYFCEVQSSLGPWSCQSSWGIRWLTRHVWRVEMADLLSGRVFRLAVERRARYQICGENPANSEGTGRNLWACQDQTIKTLFADF